MGKVPVLSDDKMKKLSQLLGSDDSINQKGGFQKKSRTPLYRKQTQEEVKSSDAVLCKLSARKTTATYAASFYENENKIGEGNVYPVELALNSVLSGGWCIAHKAMLQITGDEK